MDDLQNKIEQEKTHFKKLKNKTYVLGSCLIGLGFFLGLFLASGEGISPVAGGLTAALYMGVGIAVIMKSTTALHEQEKSIRDIRIEHKLDLLLSKS